MKSYSSADFYNIESLFSEEELMIRNTVRDFVSEKVIPIMGQCMEEARFPKELVREIAKLGLLGANLKGFDSPELNNIAYGLVMQELERGDSSIRSFASVTGSLVMYPIMEYGSEEQKSKWIPALRSGEKIGCFGLTEPDFGSDPAGMRTKAVKKGNRWILNGSKMWITNGSISDVSIVWAKVDDEIFGFLVEKDAPGFFTNDMLNKYSLRASVTSELILRDCEIPEDAILPLSKGLSSALRCLNQARYTIAWGVVGAAMACYDEALEYSKTRIQFDKPIASFQLVQQKLVEMITEITKAQLLCLQLGRLKDSGNVTHAQISMAKRNNVEMALRTARAAADILGANGITYDYQSGRHACNLESVKTYEGTHDIHTLIMGQHITGISAFK